jgi:hypothetical protein
MRNLIYQVHVGLDNPLYTVCINSVAEYCARHDIDHVILREPKLQILPLNSHRSENAVRLGYLPIYEKENAFEYFDRYDNVCILDSDIYIKPTAPNIFDEINDYEFAGVVERDMPLTPRHAKKVKKYSIGQYDSIRNEADFRWNDQGAEFYNMGLMLMNNSLKKYLYGQTPKEFLRRSEFERFINGEGNWRWSTDQTLLNYWIKKEKIRTKNLDWRWNALYRGVRDECLKDAYFVHFFLSTYIEQPIEEIIATL